MTTSDGTTTTAVEDNDEYLREIAAEKAALQTKLESRVIDKNFCLETTSSKPLNVTCYGSSSSKTPQRYLEESRLLGYILAKRGHVCINGAGSFGCMAAMNDGVHAGDGHVRGVIHEMFLADNGYFDVDSKTQKRLMRRGSSHRVFENALILNREEQKMQQQSQETTKEKHSVGRDATTTTEPIREILVAGGPDLQERKKFLVSNTDALIVMPGGPGTWDELWEMACNKQLKLHKLPIVCVNTDGYYEPFRQMLYRAFEDKLAYLPPDEIVRFASGPEEAVRFIEGLPVETNSTTSSGGNQRKASDADSQPSWQTLALTLVAGMVLGAAMTKSRVGR